MLTHQASRLIVLVEIKSPRKRNMKPAISYLRFSTPKQALGHSEERQIDDSRRYCAEKGLELNEDLSMDDKGLSAWTGKNLESGALGHFLAAVKAGKIQPGTAIIVEDLDRLSRQGFRTTYELLNAFIDNGLEVHIPDKGKVYSAEFNNNPMDIMEVVFKASKAKEDSDLKSRRIQDAKDRNKEAAINGRLYTSNIPAWLAVQDDKIIEVTEENINNFKDDKRERVPVAVVQEAYRLASLGMGRTTIFEKLNGRLNGLSMSWLTRVLCDRSVLGEFTPKGCEPISEYYGKGIIDQTLFDEVRRQAEMKRRNGKYAGGNRKHSDTADNLLQGLVYDEDRKMYYQPVNRGRYLVSKKTGERPVNRVRYDKVANKVVMILEREDWLAIRGMSESADYLVAKAELEATLSELDKTQNHLNLMNSYMEGDNTDKIEIAMRFIKKDETTIAALQARQEELQATLDAATKRSAALYQDEELRAIIREVKANPEMRMRLRAEIQKRVSRITLKFNIAQIDGVIQYVNGAERHFTIE